MKVERPIGPQPSFGNNFNKLALKDVDMYKMDTIIKITKIKDSNNITSVRVDKYK